MNAVIRLVKNDRLHNCDKNNNDLHYSFCVSQAVSRQCSSVPGANPHLSIDFHCSLMVHSANVVCKVPKIETYEKMEHLFHCLFLSLSCWEDFDPMGKQKSAVEVCFR